MDEKACCCPSRPMVRVLMPATPNRPYRVDLLLCGHHFRLSQWTLAAVRCRGPGDAGSAAADTSAMAAALKLALLFPPAR